MNEISSVSRSGLPAYKAAPTRPSAQQAAAGQARAHDQADFSVASKLLSRLSEMPDVRHELVAGIRAEIEAGTYETPEKLDAAVNEMLDDLA
jgi:anti-sigma28 factor (negative regulator of flagellin synthesis)